MRTPWSSRLLRYGSLVIMLLCGCPKTPADPACSSAADCAPDAQCVNGVCAGRTGGGSSGQAGTSTPASSRSGPGSSTTGAASSTAPSSSSGRSSGNPSGATSAPPGSGSSAGSWSLSGGASGSSGVAGCGAGEVRCAGNCVNPETDTAFCGARLDCAGPNAGETCVGKDCVGGRCEVTCPPALVKCTELNGTVSFCVDPDRSTTHCGARDDCAGANAGNLCAVGGTCNSGVCGCPAAQKDCHGTCVAETTCCDSAECLGGRYCLAAVAGGPFTCQCQTGDVECSGTCVSASGCCADGECAGGRVCGPATASGTGVIRRCECPAGQSLCNGVCTTTAGCCAAGDCGTGQQCQPPGDGGAANVCACPAGETFCAPHDRCIPGGACCANTDCPLGRACVAPTGATGAPACDCPPGTRDCNGTCLAAETCCGDADCTPGMTCQTGVCLCAPGTRACGNACIPVDRCCTQPQDCPSGLTCPGDGASCACATGTEFCGAACIATDACCSTGASCTSGHVCPAPGSTCACPAGTQECAGACVAGCCPSPDTCGNGLICPAAGGTCVSQDCAYYADDNFGACDRSCGGGTSYKYYHVTSPAQPGGACPVTDGQVAATQACNTQPCGSDCVYTTDAAFGACDAECGGGTQYKYFHVTTPASGTGSCPVVDGAVAESQACNGQPCAVDCVYTTDSAFGACSATCGGGTRYRFHHVITPASGGGTCPVADGAVAESEACNPQPCAVDCTYTTDSAFDACSAACGGGMQYRYHHVTVPASGGGSCPVVDGEVAESRACNTQACPDPCASAPCAGRDEQVCIVDSPTAYHCECGAAGQGTCRPGHCCNGNVCIMGDATVEPDCGGGGSSCTADCTGKCAGETDGCTGTCPDPCGGHGCSAGVCSPWCGDLTCNGLESCFTCPGDCGTCACVPGTGCLPNNDFCWATDTCGNPCPLDGCAPEQVCICGTVYNDVCAVCPGG